jgi:hypothetical protein
MGDRASPRPGDEPHPALPDSASTPAAKEDSVALKQYRERKLVHALLMIVLAAAASAVASTNARAALGLGNPCDSTLTQPFAPWGDRGNYTLVPGGSFESGSAWTLTGGAMVVAGNEPFAVGGSRDSHSLSLPLGSSATSPAMCVGALNPTLRLFGLASSSSASLSVTVLSKNALGLLSVLGVGIVYPGQTKWQPTPVGLFLQSLPALLTNTTTVSFRFAPVGGSWTIDDAYVDPFLSK